MKPKLLRSLFLAAAVTYFLYFYEKPVGAKVGDPAPPFTLPVKNGSVTLEQFRGKAVLINFWATWCPPCIQEMPSLQRLKQTMRGDKFEILAVSIDDEGWAAVDRFMEKQPLSLTVLLDIRGEVASLYGTYQLPESYLIDKNGIMVKKYIGPREWSNPQIISEMLRYVEAP